MAVSSLKLKGFFSLKFKTLSAAMSFGGSFHPLSCLFLRPLYLETPVFQCWPFFLIYCFWFFSIHFLFVEFNCWTFWMDTLILHTLSTSFWKMLSPLFWLSCWVVLHVPKSVLLLALLQPSHILVLFHSSCAFPYLSEDVPEFSGFLSLKSPFASGYFLFVWDFGFHVKAFLC